mgnify:CR=1 FL=1
MKKILENQGKERCLKCKRLIKILTLVVVLLLMSRIILSNHLAASGGVLQKNEEEVMLLQEKKNILEKEISDKISLNNLYKIAMEKGWQQQIKISQRIAYQR